MATRESLSEKTVAELRKIAKENHVPLPAGSSKQDIVNLLADKVADAQPAEVKPASEEGSAARRYPHAASIITDEEDMPVMTTRTPYTRPATPPPAPAPAVSRPATPVQTAVERSVPSAGHPTINRGNVPGTNKPVFSLEGVRAWQNPRSFQAQGGSGNRGMNYGSRASAPYGASRQLHQPATVSRFGPDATAVPDPAPDTKPASPYPPEGYGNSREDARGAAGPAPAGENSEFAFQNIYEAPQVNALPDLLAATDASDGEGVLEVCGGYGILHLNGFMPCREDLYVSYAQISRYCLRSGDHIKGKVRFPLAGEKYGALLYITHINGTDPVEHPDRRRFDALTAVYPTTQIVLGGLKDASPALKIIDLMCPIGFGQRAIVTAPPRCGKTHLLQEIAYAIHHDYPQAHLISFLCNERPEAITEAKALIPGEVLCTAIDDPAENHIKASELILARAERLAEAGQDVVLVVDSLTTLSRACNDCAPQNARMLSGGLIAGATDLPKRLFGAARCLKEGGSLTIIAIVTGTTGIALDDAIRDEFRGMANMELYLTKHSPDKRLCPGVDLVHSTTRHERLMQRENILTCAESIRDQAREKGNDTTLVSLLNLMERYQTPDSLADHIGQLNE